MAFDFPASPTTGQMFTPAGGPTYTWNGYAWAQDRTIGFQPTTRVFVSGSGTYTPPAGVAWIEVELVGGGAGGASGTSGAGGQLGTSGTPTTFGSLIGSAGGNNGIGGVPSGGDVNIKGGDGGQFGNIADTVQFAIGTNGGVSFFGGAGGAFFNSAGYDAAANSGSGGGGGGTNTTASSLGGRGGGAGGYVRKLFAPPAASYAYVVGTGGAGAPVNGNNFAGGRGADGIIIVTEYYYGAAASAASVATRTQIQVIASSGMYTPSANLVSAIVECIGGGGAGGAATGAANQEHQGAGGGSGGYSRRSLTAAQIGASQTVTIGNGGAGGASNGGNGTATSFGALVVANGGSGGIAMSSGSSSGVSGGPGAVVAGAVGDVIVAGTPGHSGFFNNQNASIVATTGSGGPGPLGGGATTVLGSGGVNANGYGAGGSGGNAHQTTSTLNGGNGSAGICIVTEFIAALVATPVATVPAPQCGLLAYVSATALSFKPFNGNQIKINGSLYTIPTAGIAGLANTNVFVNGVAGQNLSGSVFFYLIFAFINGGVVTADFRSSTTHATSITANNEGVEILTGDDTRTLIGMCKMSASSQFTDTQAARWVRTWFNRQAAAMDMASPSITYSGFNSSAWVALGFSVEWLNWANEVVHVAWEGTVSHSVATSWVNCGIGLDTSTTNAAPDTLSFASVGAGYRYCFATSFDQTMSEGYHYATAIGANQPGGSATWYAPNNPGVGNRLHGRVG